MNVAKWFTLGATLSLLAAPALASDASADREPALSGSTAFGGIIYPVYAAKEPAPAQAKPAETPKDHACACCARAK